MSYHGFKHSEETKAKMRLARKKLFESGYKMVTGIKRTFPTMPCKNCGETTSFFPFKNKPILGLCTKCRRNHWRKEYRKDPAVKKKEKNYSNSDKGRALMKKRKRKYNRSEKGKIKNKLYRQSDKGKASSKKSCIRFKKSPKGKQWQWDYIRSERGKEVYSNCSHRRRELTKSGHITKEEWASVLKEYEYKCASCGTKSRIEMDHIIPLSKGGTHSKDNIQPLCRHCNATKHTKII